MNKIIHLWQKLIYGVLKRRPDIDMSKIPASLKLDVPMYFAKNYPDAMIKLNTWDYNTCVLTEMI